MVLRRAWFVSDSPGLCATCLPQVACQMTFNVWPASRAEDTSHDDGSCRKSSTLDRTRLLCASITAQIAHDTLRDANSRALAIADTLHSLLQRGYFPEDTKLDELIRNAMKIPSRGCRFERLMSPTYGGTSFILKALEYFSGMTCSDNRDCLFALLSITHGCTMRPDYSLSTEQVYIALAKSLVHHGYLTAVLGVSARQWCPTRRLFNTGSPNHLPSWVPDLRMSVIAWDTPYLPETSDAVVVTEASLSFIARIGLIDFTLDSDSWPLYVRAGDYVCRIGGSRKQDLAVRPLILSEEAPVSFMLVGEQRCVRDNQKLPDSSLREERITLY